MITNLSQQAWDEKTIELGGSILQSWSWGEFQKSLGHKIYRFSGSDFTPLEARTKDAAVASGNLPLTGFINLAIEEQLPLGKKNFYCPRGPLGNIEAAMEDLKKLSSDSSVIFTRIEPLQPVKLLPAAKEIQPSHNWVLDLEKSEEEILIGAKPKTRYNINLASRKGVVVRQGGQSDLMAVWKLFLETATRNNYKLHPQNYYWQMWDYLSPDNLQIFLAEYQGQPLAAMLLTRFGPTATYLHGGSSPRMKEAMAPYLLHWEAIRMSKKLGYRNYDFGGIAPKDQDGHAWAGISRFKKGFGGFEVTYPGTFDLVYSPIWYNVYKQGRELLRGYRF